MTYRRRRRSVRSRVDTLADRGLISHVKDVKRTGSSEEKHAAIDVSEAHSFRGVGSVELPAPGLGSHDHDDYPVRLSRKHPNIPWSTGRLDEADIPRAKKFIDGRLRAYGV